MGVPSEFSERVMIIRKRLGLNQTQFAKKIGAIPANISNMENGRATYPSFIILYGIWKNVKNVNIDYIFSGKGKPFFDDSFKKNQVETLKKQMEEIQHKLSSLE